MGLMDVLIGMRNRPTGQRVARPVRVAAYLPAGLSRNSTPHRDWRFSMAKNKFDSRVWFKVQFKNGSTLDAAISAAEFRRVDTLARTIVLKRQRGGCAR